MPAARRIDDTKIDRLEGLIRDQTDAINAIAVSVARVEEKLKRQDDKIAASDKQIEAVKNAQRWVVFTVLGAFLTSIVNFFFRGSN